ncbi:hypothetical protein TIFTF001_010687 [Ficus carica]|uniref:Uncharacterized protein n=1 Tax=Ficus carica TaxID=3494 RepID=A0AA87ZYL0_FICCA|nr:hypothetical protein TIFTF001_010687 [Ficus carica]
MKLSNFVTANTGSITILLQDNGITSLQIKHKGRYALVMNVGDATEVLTSDGVVVKKRNRQKLDEEITNTNARPHSEVKSLAHRDDDESLAHARRFGGYAALVLRSSRVDIKEFGGGTEE